MLICQLHQLVFFAENMRYSENCREAAKRACGLECQRAPCCENSTFPYGAGFPNEPTRFKNFYLAQAPFKPIKHILSLVSEHVFIDIFAQLWPIITRSHIYLLSKFIFSGVSDRCLPLGRPIFDGQTGRVDIGPHCNSNMLFS